MDENRARQIGNLINLILNALGKLRMVCSSRCCESECRMNEKNNNNILEDEDPKTGHE